MNKEAEQSWQIFKETFLRSQELSIPRRSGKAGKKQPCQTGEQDENAQAMETQTSALAVQGQSQEGHGPTGTELVRDAKKNKKGFNLHVN